MKYFSFNSLKIFSLLLLTIVQICFLIIGFLERIDNVSINYIYELFTSYQDSIEIFIFSFLVSIFLLIRRINIYFSFLIIGILFLIFLGFYKLLFLISLFLISSISLCFIFFKDDFSEISIFKKIYFSICFYLLTLNLLIFFPVNNYFLYFSLLVLPILFVIKNNSFVNIVNQNLLGGYLKSSNDQSILDVLIISILSIYFFAGLMPEAGYDALATHLFIPSYINQYKLWDFDVNSYIWAVFPLGGELFFSFIYIFAGEQASKFSLFILLIIILYILKFICAKINVPSKGLILLTISTPLIYLESSSMFIDLFWLMAGLMLVALMISFHIEKQISTFNFILALLSFAIFINSKLIALIYVFPLFLYFVYFVFISKNVDKSKLSVRHLRNIFIILIAIIWCFSPFLIAYFFTNNPVFPFFNSIFKSDLIEVSNWTNSIFTKFIDYNILYNITFKSHHYLEAPFGAPGFFWILIFIPMSIQIFFRKFDFISALYFYSLITFVSVFYFQSYLRYVLPSLVLFYIVFQKVYFECSYEINLFEKINYKIFNLFFPACILLNLLFFHSATWYGKINHKILFDKSLHNSYIETHLPIKKLKEYVINKYNSYSLNKNILFLSNPQLAYSPVKPIIINWYNSNAYHDFFNSLENEEDFIAFCEKYNFSLIIYEDHIFINYLKDNVNKDALYSNFIKYTHELEKVGSSSLRVVRYLE